VLPFDHGGAGDPADGPGAPLAEIGWIEPYPDEQGGLDDAFASPEARYELRESVELAFIAALQHLPARQRAVLVLREALGFSAQEVADLLETTVASVYSALQRARASVDDRLPAASQQETLKALGDERLRAIVDDYVAAWERGDVGAVVAMLAEEATMAMPPMAMWFRGRDACEVFLRKWAFGQRWAGERFEEGERDVKLADITAFVSTQIFPAYGLPESL
jgi:RNA polymerase sigma-70 factor (ECF subfamily)